LRVNKVNGKATMKEDYSMQKQRLIWVLVKAFFIGFLGQWNQKQIYKQSSTCVCWRCMEELAESLYVGF